VLETVIARIEEGMWRWGFPVPDLNELALFGAASDS
jgi:hypothetical protein